MNEYVDMYKRLMDKYPKESKEYVYVTVTSIISAIGNMDDLKELNTYYKKEVEEEWEWVANEPV